MISNCSPTGETTHLYGRGLGFRHERNMRGQHFFFVFFHFALMWTFWRRLVETFNGASAKSFAEINRRKCTSVGSRDNDMLPVLAHKTSEVIRNGTFFKKKKEKDDAKTLCVRRDKWSKVRLFGLVSPVQVRGDRKTHNSRYDNVVWSRTVFNVCSFLSDLLPNIILDTFRQKTNKPQNFNFLIIWFLFSPTWP